MDNNTQQNSIQKLKASKTGCNHNQLSLLKSLHICLQKGQKLQLVYGNMKFKQKGKQRLLVSLVYMKKHCIVQNIFCYVLKSLSNSYWRKHLCLKMILLASLIKSPSLTSHFKNAIISSKSLA